MLTVGERDKTQEKECPEECREAEEGKAAMVEAEGKNIQSEHRKMKDPTVRYKVNEPRGKKMLHRNIKFAEGCRQKGNNPKVQRPEATEVTENKHKVWHDKPLGLNRFPPGQLVLKYDGQNDVHQERFKARWIGPYQFQEVGDNGVIKLGMLNGQKIPHAVNRSYCVRKMLLPSPSPLQNDQMVPSSSSLQNGDGRRQI